MTGIPALPTLPALPAITSFPAVGTVDISSSKTITPGSYKKVTLAGKKTITFSGPGVYVFSSIKNSGNTNNFVFDFQNNTSGTFRLYIYGDVDLGKLNQTIINGGNASRIYAETHGTGSSSSSGKDAWIIANGSSGGNNSKWMGTVWAPYAAIKIGSGTGSSNLTGAFWSGTQVNIQSGVTITYAPYSECSIPNANAGADKTLTCTNPTIHLSGSSSTPGATFSWVASNGGNIISGANTATPTVNTAGTYTLTVTSPAGCIATDMALVTVNKTLPNVNAGTDKQLTCTVTTIQLNGSSTTPGVQFNWIADDGSSLVSGSNTATPVAGSPASYILTVTNPSNGCTAKDTAVVTFSPCILPYYPPPSSGKVTDDIGSELLSLYNNFGTITDSNSNNIFLIMNDSVYIEVISLAGMYQTLLALLQTPAYGMTDLIDNGPSTLIISGKYPIVNLLKLDSLPTLIDYVRPLYPAISNSGVAYTRGDISMGSDIARKAFNVAGDGVKIGVMSDSYNTILGNPAQTDILNGDLPGVGNPDDSIPVHVLKDYPYGRRTDEGRAMLQIVHDVAPKSELAFRTGFISEGDFAEGIKALQQDSCDIIVDDITFITAPFFQDGVVAKAVDEVTGQGVSYFSAAGNYGNKSYQHTFSPAPAPNGITGKAHNFSGGDIFQNISLTPGNYTIVLQWQDSIYSLFQTQTGTQNDLDIYLTYDNGKTLFGFNRNNIGCDPIEVLPFTVTANSTTNIMIVRAAGTQNVNFKYIVFQGDPTINEYHTGTSTIVGQANAAGAIAVGAALYTNTPAYGVNPPTIASFSSTGGTPVNGVIRNKPNITAPNGVNTTVNMGGVNIDGDAFPNFFGTSAAAPHAAAIAGLLLQAKKKFYNETLSPAQVRSLLQTYTYDMATPGFDFTSGYGFVRADAAMLSFAAPTPVINSLVYDTTIVPGTQAFTLKIEGDYFTSQSLIYFRGNPLPTTVLSDSELSATIPAFLGTRRCRYIIRQ